MRFNRFVTAAAMVAVAAMNIGAAAPGGPTRFGQIDDRRALNAAKEPQNWLLHGGNHEAWNYSALEQINPSNIAQLKPAWFLEFDTNREQQATPIVVDGVAYVATGWSKIYAVNAKTGAVIWQYDAKVPGETGPKSCCGIQSRGVAVYKGKVYIGSLDGRVIAVDARTGKELWATPTFDKDDIFVNTAAVRVANGVVYSGQAGGEFGGRGFLTAVNADTGKKMWKFYLTPGRPGVKDGEPSDEIMDKIVQPTWFGEYNEYRGGANPWGSIVYDPEFDQVYIGTGNGYPWLRVHRSDNKGGNLFIASVVALDAKTGKYRWHYQEVPGESYDADAVGPIQLLDLKIGGQNRKVLTHVNKNGVFWVLDRKTGKLVTGVPFVQGIDYFTGFDKDGLVISRESAFGDNKVGARSCCAGAHSWQPISYSPKTGWVYMQASQGPGGSQIPMEKFEYVKGLDHIGIYAFGLAIPPEVTARQPGPPPAGTPQTPRRSFLQAWDPVNNKPAWQTDGNGGGVLATGGNLVFQGAGRNIMGTLNAFRADTGEKIWSYNTPNAMQTAPVSYMIDGEQYLMIVSGAASGIGSVPDPKARQNGRLLAFKLNGTATLPPDPGPAPPLLNLTAEQAPRLAPADLAWASDKYAELCAHCHGINAGNNNVIPDLRRSPYTTSAEAWKAVVEDGALTATGMVGWTKYLPPGGSEKIRLYVAERTRVALAAPPPGAGGGAGAAAAAPRPAPAPAAPARPAPAQAGAAPLHGAEN